MTRPPYGEILARLNILVRLADYDPHVTGTPPLGIDIATSDIDILCHAPKPAAFASALWAAFSRHSDFSLYRWIGDGRAVIARFTAGGWPIEIFGAMCPVSSQSGWRHFMVERRLLILGGSAFKAAVMAMRMEGLKTEPAFACCLSLAGDPYTALLDLERQDDRTLATILRANGF